MTQKFVVPTSNGILDPHFGHCSHFTIIEVTNNLIMDESIIDAPPHQPGILPRFLAEKGATDVIAGGMGQSAINIFNQ
ncbi:MAG: ATPase, partial [Marinilabiliaceae bacterium]|nr:ATPase [Marinilabiliaceae bacterium]